MRSAIRISAACLIAASSAVPAIVLGAPTSPTHFTRDPALLKAKEQKLIEGMRAQNPQAADALAKAFSRDIIVQLQPTFREMHLDSDDMADMMAAYWVNAWEASNGIVGRKTDPALMQGVRKQIAAILAENGTQTTDAQRQDVADTMILQGLLIAARMEAAAQHGADAQRQMSDAIAREAQQTTKVDMRSMTLTGEGFRPKGAAAAGSAAPPAAARPGSAFSAAPASAGGAPAHHPENWKGVEGVYFRSAYIMGVGGMMIQDFQPVVLFHDGSYYRVEGEALEDIDLAAARTARPVRWGHWQKTAAGYVLTSNEGQASKPLPLQGGQFYKAFAAEAAGNKLANTYTRVSGGGNTALGGDTIVAAQTDLTFAADGNFRRESGGSGSKSGQWTGASVAVSARNANAGRYQIRNFTIAMTQPDGGTRRQFFAFGSQHNPAVIDTGMMFVGSNVFTAVHDR